MPKVGQFYPISKLIESLPDFITIDNDTYKGLYKKARFIDSEYGEYWTYPKYILKGRCHIKRSKREAASKIRLPIETIKAKLPSHITIDESTYTNSRTKARFTDSEYGEFWAVPYNVMRGSGHPQIKKNNMSKNITLSVSEVKSRLPDNIIIDESTYTKASAKARFIDSEYGEWWNTPNNIFNGHRHPKKATDSSIIPLNKIKERLPEHLDIDSSTYINTTEKCKFIDSEYGEFWARPTHVLHQNMNHRSRFRFRSKSEDEVRVYISSIVNVNITTNQTFYDIISTRCEIDIYIPDKKIGVEYHGLYWHSDKHKHKLYHRDKLVSTSKMDITLLQIYSDEWEFKQDIVKSIIKAKLGISDQKYYARKLTIKDVNNNEAQSFLKDSHLMGEYKSAKHIGLYDKDILISMISYKKHKDGIDISRFCNKLNTSVAGGLSRLLKEIEKREQPKFIQSWVDLRYGTGDSLKAIGFTHKRTTLGWKWTDGINTYNRLKCRANMDGRNLTEKQHADELGWYRIYDAGQALFIR